MPHVNAALDGVLHDDLAARQGSGVKGSAKARTVRASSMFSDTATRGSALERAGMPLVGPAATGSGFILIAMGIH